MPGLEVSAIEALPRSEIVVGVGDFRVAVAPSRFLATYGLGSCVAVVLFDWRTRAGALLHVMMPDSSIQPRKARRQPFAYVDTAMPKMIEAVTAIGMLVRRSRCCVVGGAAMIASPAHFEIGRRNVAAVRAALANKGILIEREEVGGAQSRSVRLDLESGAITMHTGDARALVLLQPSAPLIRLHWNPRDRT